MFSFGLNYEVRPLWRQDATATARADPRFAHSRAGYAKQLRPIPSAFPGHPRPLARRAGGGALNAAAAGARTAHEVLKVLAVRT